MAPPHINADTPAVSPQPKPRGPAPKDPLTGVRQRWNNITAADAGTSNRQRRPPGRARAHCHWDDLEGGWSTDELPGTRAPNATSTEGYPFKSCRRQFPVLAAFAMTINKV